MHLEAGVCGCRVGFNGERIHFGSGGCRCVGGNKNRGLVDWSSGNAFDSALTFAREVIEASPELAWNSVCQMCNCIKFIARVSLALMYVLIQICAYLSGLIRELDKYPTVGSIALGLTSEYCGEENSASIVLGFL